MSRIYNKDKELSEVNNQELRESDGKLSFKTPFLSGEITGKHVIVAVFAILLTAPICYGIFIHHQQAEKEAAQILEQLRILNDSQEATTYILTLTQEQRNSLQLNKPKRIREMEITLVSKDSEKARYENTIRKP